MDFNTTYWLDSSSCPGVRIRLRRITFAARTELIRTLHPLLTRLTFLQAGSAEGDRSEQIIIDRSAQQLLLEWAVVETDGIKIDGEAPTPSILCNSAPEGLVNEIVTNLVTQFGLTDDQRKN